MKFIYLFTAFALFVYRATGASSDGLQTYFTFDEANSGNGSQFVEFN
jgi:hypothetical protein